MAAAMQRGPHHVQVDGQAGDVHHAVVVADGDVAAGEHEAGCSLDPLRNDDAPHVDHEEQLEDDETGDGTDAQRAVQEHQPDGR